MGKVKYKEVVGRINFGDSHPVVIPQPCLVVATYNEDDTANAMLVAWGGMCDYNRVFISLGEHKTTENIKKRKAFTISFADAKTICESDFFGLVSAYKIDNKVLKAGFSYIDSPNVDAPIIIEYPLTLECSVIELKQAGIEGYYAIAEIVNMSASQEILDIRGKIDIDKIQPLLLNPIKNEYRTIGNFAGRAYSIGKQLYTDKI